MIDHVALSVSDLAEARAFYTQALRPLGYSVVFDRGDSLGLGADRKPDLWIAAQGATNPHIHLAFVAKDRATVDAFYAAALAAGGADNGAPGLRPHYHATYYGAFVRDPDGNNIEAVVHRPE